MNEHEHECGYQEERYKFKICFRGSTSDYDVVSRSFWREVFLSFVSLHDHAGIILSAL